MKYNKSVTSSRRKQRRSHFGASSGERRKRMSSTLNAELRTKHNVRSLPIRKDDEVIVLRGKLAGKEGKVVEVYRKKYVIHIEKLTREKINGQTVHIPIHPSNVVITKLKLDRARNALIARKAIAREKSLKSESGMNQLD
jgi:large subunit ribosomal protein L26e